MVPKDYLGYENTRNRAHADVFTEVLRRALGPEYSVLVGHHFAFQRGGDISTENEIPSADTIIFDHEIMTAAFGDEAIRVMRDLAQVTVEYREAVLARWLKELPAP